MAKTWLFSLGLEGDVIDSLSVSEKIYSGVKSQVALCSGWQSPLKPLYIPTNSTPPNTPGTFPGRFTSTSSSLAFAESQSVIAQGPPYCNVAAEVVLPVVKGLGLVDVANKEVSHVYAVSRGF
jgi:hypothetical protein